MKVSMIVAASANNVIGVDGGLPWRLSEDLRRFKEITLGKPMIMGRLTFESIGKALPGRRSIVITRQANYEAEGCDVVTTMDAALELASDADEVMIIGGGKVYEQLLPMTDRIYLTRVHADFDGDTFFPEIREDEWQIVSSEPLPSNDERPFSISFQTLERIS
ncbi:MAG: dihydrofolate reductase [Proteobacteria bacterium]|nr:dihydrofolate reductase [Pseudomonadota bacterium]